MTYDEAYSEAIDGAHLTADHMQPGSYLSYAFAGWRINFAGGSSSGFSPREQDRAADWRICGPDVRAEIRKVIGPNVNNDFGKWGAPVKRDSWGRPL